MACVHTNLRMICRITYPLLTLLTPGLPQRWHVWDVASINTIRCDRGRVLGRQWMSDMFAQDRCSGFIFLLISIGLIDDVPQLYCVGQVLERVRRECWLYALCPASSSPLSAILLSVACLFASMPLMQGDVMHSQVTRGGFCYADFTNKAQAATILFFTMAFLAISTGLWIKIGRWREYWYYYTIFFFFSLVRGYYGRQLQFRRLLVLLLIGAITLPSVIEFLVVFPFVPKRVSSKLVTSLRRVSLTTYYINHEHTSANPYHTWLCRIDDAILTLVSSLSLCSEDCFYLQSQPPVWFGR